LRTDRPTSDLSFGPHWGKFKRPYLHEGSSDPFHVWFYGGVFEVGGSNGANSGLNKCNRYVGEENNARGVTRLVTTHDLFLVHIMLGFLNVLGVLKRNRSVAQNQYNNSNNNQICRAPYAKAQG